MNMDWILKCFPDYEFLVEYDNIENTDKIEIHGLEERHNVKCTFCGMPFRFWKKKDEAHAISECVGNKKLINYCECYDCNHLFGEIAENHLGKFIMPYRIINEIYGKGKGRNVVKDMQTQEDLSYRTYRFEQRKNESFFPGETFDVHNMLIEKTGSGRLKQTEKGFRLSIPRQKYEPQQVYVSLLKMAYTILPTKELVHYVKGLRSLYIYISMKPCYGENGNQITEPTSIEDKMKYMDSLSNWGLEIMLLSNSVPNGVNVCLLKRNKEGEKEPKLMFAIQMRRHTIAIPVLSDDSAFEGECKCRLVENDSIALRKLDFNKVEEEFVCDLVADSLGIPTELFCEFEKDLKDKKLLK